MNNDVGWEVFLSGKGRTARTHYSERRTCCLCGCPVVNGTASRLCRRCKPSKKFTTRGESVGHKELKRRARQFLVSLGCVDISEEYHVGRLRVDVLGFLGGKRVAVECGGSAKKKLVGLRGRVYRLYILPYGALEPVHWDVATEICKLCGNEV